MHIIMAGPYRETASSSIQCPRCSEQTPPGDLVACIDGCGIWVAAEIANDVLEPAELHPSRITSWFRKRCACPMCGTQMTLRGHDMSLFLGCDTHGMWIDDSTVTQTGLGRAAVAARLIDARKAAASKRAERDRLKAEEDARRSAELRTLEEHIEADARARKEAIAAAARALQARQDAVRPYLELLRMAVRDPLPLAEKLHELEQRIARLEGGE
jgi:hypothetical protein